MTDTPMAVTKYADSMKVSTVRVTKRGISTRMVIVVRRTPLATPTKAKRNPLVF
ncbi:hypothetical protein [Alpinimonas psychrophila]|uniref:Uncharacterized protein n=1 Tax=Alpinimonas psychrophila TaxID=748908 RepID=A0A7W3JT54_9MICO|nr:hypothetical protein [Alpinimonas psychrophila]MBA8828687.1 hypothetical protein [Alpinimonas psychrophila]